MEITISNFENWSQSLEHTVLGQSEAVELCLIALVAGGHILLEGPPGVGKTSLAQAIAESIQGDFRRIQMTSDLLPSDILGTLRMKPGANDLEFRKGPVFTNVLLADELNRTSAKTQSALLEAMAEGRVSVDGKTYSLPDPFFVVATQNPQEFQGVYPLTESQLDRFMIHVDLNIPKEEAELELLKRHADSTIKKSQFLPLQASSFSKFREQAKKIFLEESVLEYIQKIAQEIRKIEGVYYGASVRSTLQLIDAAKARALLKNRDFALPEDIRILAPHIFAHRLSFRGIEQRSSEKKERIRNALDQISSPK